MKRRDFLMLSGAIAAFGRHHPPLLAEEPLLPVSGLKLHPASFWQPLDDKLVGCQLCPNKCSIAIGKRGRCRARINREGKLYSIVYGNLSTIAIDPIEKKPVFHVLPGTFSLSISAAGCVLSCRYCQNWQISQSLPEKVCDLSVTPEDIVEKAIKMECKSISYTYNEPTVFYEFMYDTALLAQKKGLKNIMVSCGYINEEPLKKLLPVIDVIKVDLKGFSEEFYKTVTHGHLEPVKQTIVRLARAGKLLDIVCLIVPGINDDEEECRKMFSWLRETGGQDLSLFLSRFYPTYQLRNVSPTPVSKLETLRKIAIDEGLNYVYIGNVPGHDGENTFCPRCKKALIRRLGYQILENLLKDGCCFNCGEKIPGIWN